MARYVLFGLALLALCALAAAEFWPAGIKGAEQLEELSAGPSRASIAAAKSYGSSKYKSAKKKYSNHYYSSKHADEDEKEYDEDEKEYKPSHKKYETHKPSYTKSHGYGKEDYDKPHKKKHVKPLPPGKYPKGYATAPPGTGPKDDDEWFEGDGDYNKPYSHADEHTDDCIGSRHVAVTGPANAGGLCPPQSTLFDAQVCDVPAFCGKNGSPFVNPQAPCACPEGEFLRFDAHQVQDHFENQPGPFQVVDVTRHTYECVDARGSGPMLGTPGGDLAELMAAAMAIMKLTGQKYSQAIADEVFAIFSDEVANEERPLYFHTDDGSLRRLFRSLEGKLSTGKRPSIFPWKGPSGADGEAWLNALKAAQFNGCGHIRLMIDPTTTAFYSATIAGSAVTACPDGKLTPDTCIDAGALAQRIIEKFFRYWWFTDSGSEEREKIAFAVDGILEGPLLGKAVTIIQNAGPEADACPGHAPLVDPSFGASQVFVYHGAAVLQWRAFVGEEYFGELAEKYGFTTDQFIGTWTDIANMQLGATLTYLEPANRVGQFVVDVPSKDVSDYVKVGEEEEYEAYKDTDSNGYYKAPYTPYKDGYEAPPSKYGYESPPPKYGPPHADGYGYNGPPPKNGYAPPSPKYGYEAPPPKYGYEGPPKYRR